MSNKEPIMTDNVDVSGCKYLDTRVFSGNSYWCQLFHNFCNATNYNYNYIHCFDKCPVYQLNKQLARKTQECKELKKLADANPNSTLRLRNEIRDLQAVSVKRKEALEKIEEIASKDYYDDTWADISIKIDKILDIIIKYKGLYDRYNLALTNLEILKRQLLGDEFISEKKRGTR